MTTLEVGGRARYFASCKTVDELRKALSWANENRHPVFVLGAGSNILVSDSGFDGLVVRCRSDGVEFQTDGDDVSVSVDAGVDWDDFVGRCTGEGLAGIECLSGIPGLVGAAPIQNIGAYGQEVASSIVSVSGVDMTTGRQIRVPAVECGFGYRTSLFKTAWKTFAVTSVEFSLRKHNSGFVEYPDLKKLLRLDEAGASPPTLTETRNAVLEIRSQKSMVISADDPNRRSAGSFFLNPVLEMDEYATLRDLVRRKGIARDVPSFRTAEGLRKIPAAWLIEQSGYKRGTSDGAVGLSSKHALAIVNTGSATATDIVVFAAKVRRAVMATFGVALSPEPVFVGFGTDADSLLSAAA